MLFIILIAIFSIIFFLILSNKQRKNKQYRFPPGPKKLPFIGNLHQFDPSKPAHVFFSKLAKIYGPIMSLQLGQRTMVMIQSPRIAKSFLLAQDNNYYNRFLPVSARMFSYNGLGVFFSPYNENYIEMKKMFVVHLLNSKVVQSFASIRREEVSRIIHKISDLSYNSEIVNLSDLATNFTNSNISRVAFGKRYENEDGTRSNFHGLLSEAQALFAGFFFADHFPSLGWVDKITGQYSRLEKTFKKMDEFYEKVIEDHLNKPKSHQEDIIDILLRLKNEGSFAFELTMEHIKATLMDLFIGGTDTTAAMIVWVITELMRNPSAMEKVQKEIRSVSQNKSYIEEDELVNLQYFKAVLKETFRMHPPLPLLIPRESIKRSTIDGYDILPKTTISINLWALGRNPESWTDPNLFIPERFLGSSQNFLGLDFDMIPFGAGKRICPGINFGVVNLELVLANLLHFFNWKLPMGLNKEDIDTDVQLGITMHKKNPLCLIANKSL
ncbi:cytochrome P450 71A1-like [Amaranthus tricolor]|uniref:cytochrome P450 71A1-like n=1 Tax=Amaranthus tricolor TaxID=29722 RepID=UPI00258774EB|nr:cytochrome P450 71A1-like [Amaranthus tricolor]